MSNYVYWAEDSSEALEHYGILGQSRGRRRYQYEDGSLTPAGKIRYRDGVKSTSSGAAAKEYVPIDKNKSKYTYTPKTSVMNDRTYANSVGNAAAFARNPRGYMSNEGGFMLSNVQFKADNNGAELEGLINNPDIKKKTDGSSRDWVLKTTIDKYGNTDVNVFSASYGKDTRSVLKKAADTYVSGWNTIKDTYVSGLKTIAGWFK